MLFNNFESISQSTSHSFIHNTHISIIMKSVTIVAFALLAAVHAQDQCTALAAKIPQCAVGCDDTSSASLLMRGTRSNASVLLLAAQAARIPRISPVNARTSTRSTPKLLTASLAAASPRKALKLNQQPPLCANVSHLLAHRLAHRSLRRHQRPRQSQRPQPRHPARARLLTQPQFPRLAMARSKLARPQHRPLFPRRRLLRRLKVLPPRLEDLSLLLWLASWSLLLPCKHSWKVTKQKYWYPRGNRKEFDACTSMIQRTKGHKETRCNYG